MLEFKTEKLSNRITRIYAFASEMMYLVEGDEKAALLDTGSGFGSLRDCVSKLTDKPIITLSTHGHVDHAMGAAEFDVNYMNHEDDYVYSLHSKEEFRKGGTDLTPEGDVFTDENYIPSLPVEQFLDLKEGNRFDLGGVSIEIYACPGHTKGSVVMLIPEERAVLLGDACNYFIFLFDDYSTSVTTYEESLKTLKRKIDGKFDTVYLSHGDGKGHKEIMDDVIEVCEDIINGNADDQPFVFMGIPGTIAKAVDSNNSRLDGGRGNIVYNKNNVK